MPFRPLFVLTQAMNQSVMPIIKSFPIFSFVHDAAAWFASVIDEVLVPTQMTHRREIVNSRNKLARRAEQVYVVKNMSTFTYQTDFIAPFQLFELTEEILLKTAILACTFARSLDD